ncbi:hypothetical protein GCM10027169_04150 [Gordonia jinhuaensis]|uniref:Uncharacterized protein n=1 Tax=Gordonia jinhuaensis TaxID=1517702 RepID=A0A916SU34_9ACTN|nr:hypothetical protein GCM10011489_01110 [Gordonia jinhuaensis]
MLVISLLNATRNQRWARDGDGLPASRDIGSTVIDTGIPRRWHRSSVTRVIGEIMATDHNPRHVGVARLQLTGVRIVSLHTAPGAPGRGVLMFSGGDALT